MPGQEIPVNPGVFEQKLNISSVAFKNAKTNYGGLFNLTTDPSLLIDIYNQSHPQNKRRRTLSNLDEIQKAQEYGNNLAALNLPEDADSQQIEAKAIAYRKAASLLKIDEANAGDLRIVSEGVNAAIEAAKKLGMNKPEDKLYPGTGGVIERLNTDATHLKIDQRLKPIEKVRQISRILHEADALGYGQESIVHKGEKVKAFKELARTARLDSSLSVEDLLNEVESLRVELRLNTNSKPESILKSAIVFVNEAENGLMPDIETSDFKQISDFVVNLADMAHIPNSRTMKKSALTGKIELEREEGEFLKIHDAENIVLTDLIKQNQDFRNKAKTEAGIRDNDTHISELNKTIRREARRADHLNAFDTNINLSTLVDHLKEVRNKIKEAGIPVDPDLGIDDLKPQVAADFESAGYEVVAVHGKITEMADKLAGIRNAARDAIIFGDADEPMPELNQKLREQGRFLGIYDLKEDLSELAKKITKQVNDAIKQGITITPATSFIDIYGLNNETRALAAIVGIKNADTIEMDKILPEMRFRAKIIGNNNADNQPVNEVAISISDFQTEAAAAGYNDVLTKPLEETVAQIKIDAKNAKFQNGDIQNPTFLASQLKDVRENLFLAHVKNARTEGWENLNRNARDEAKKLGLPVSNDDELFDIANQIFSIRRSAKHVGLNSNLETDSLVQQAKDLGLIINSDPSSDFVDLISNIGHIQTEGEYLGIEDVKNKTLQEIWDTLKDIRAKAKAHGLPDSEQKGADEINEFFRQEVGDKIGNTDPFATSFQILNKEAQIVSDGNILNLPASLTLEEKFTQIETYRGDLESIGIIGARTANLDELNNELDKLAVEIGEANFTDKTRIIQKISDIYHESFTLFIDQHKPLSEKKKTTGDVKDRLGKIGLDIQNLDIANLLLKLDKARSDFELPGVMFDNSGNILKVLQSVEAKVKEAKDIGAAGDFSEQHKAVITFRKTAAAIDIQNASNVQINDVALTMVEYTKASGISVNENEPYYKTAERVNKVLTEAMALKIPKGESLANKFKGVENFKGDLVLLGIDITNKKIGVLKKELDAKASTAGVAANADKVKLAKEVLAKKGRVEISEKLIRLTSPGHYEISAVEIKDWEKVTNEDMLRNLNMIIGGDFEYSITVSVHTRGLLSEEEDSINDAQALIIQIKNDKNTLRNMEKTLKDLKRVNKLDTDPIKLRTYDAALDVSDFLDNPAKTDRDLDDLITQLKILNWTNIGDKTKLQQVFDNNIRNQPNLYHAFHEYQILKRGLKVGGVVLSDGIDQVEEKLGKKLEDYKEKRLKDYQETDEAELTTHLTRTVPELRAFFGTFNSANINTLIELIKSEAIIEPNTPGIPAIVKAAFRFISKERRTPGLKADDERYPNELYLSNSARILSGLGGKVQGT